MLLLDVQRVHTATSKCATVSHHQYQVSFISRYNTLAEDVHMIVLLDMPKVSSLTEKNYNITRYIR